MFCNVVSIGVCSKPVFRRKILSRGAHSSSVLTKTDVPVAYLVTTLVLCLQQHGVSVCRAFRSVEQDYTIFPKLFFYNKKHILDKISFYFSITVFQRLKLQYSGRANLLFTVIDAIHDCLGYSPSRSSPTQIISCNFYVMFYFCGSVIALVLTLSLPGIDTRYYIATK